MVIIPGALRQQDKADVRHVHDPFRDPVERDHGDAVTSLILIVRIAIANSAVLILNGLPAGIVQTGAYIPAADVDRSPPMQADDEQAPWRVQPISLLSRFSDFARSFTIATTMMSWIMKECRGCC